MRADPMSTTGAAPENGARCLDRFLLPTERRVHTCRGRQSPALPTDRRTMNNRQLDELRSMEAFEDEVKLLAEERGITFSAALALKTGEAAPTATKKRMAMAEADLEELREGIRELRERSLSNLEMACGQWFAQMMEVGEIERRAQEKGIPYQVAFAELSEEAYRPLTEAELARSSQGYGAPVEHDDEAAVRLSLETLGKTEEPPRVDLDEAALDSRARAYAEEHGVGYGVALEAVLEEM